MAPQKSIMWHERTIGYEKKHEIHLKRLELQLAKNDLIKKTCQDYPD